MEVSLRRIRRVSIVAVSTALIAAMGPAVSATEVTMVEPSAPPGGLAKVESAPDLVSAQVAARAQGARVEVEELRDEFSSTWVNPDGSLTTQAHAGQIRFAGEDGQWVDVDLSAQAAKDGSAGAGAHPLEVSLSGKSKDASGVTRTKSGETALVAVAESADESVALSWPGVLPVPRLEGVQATYADVPGPAAGAGVDVVVSNLRSGFRWDVHVTTAEARDRVLAGVEGDPVWEFGLDVAGLTPRAEDDGSISFLDDEGELVSMLTAPAAWDDVVDENSLERVNQVPVDMELLGEGKDTRVRLSVDRDWFADESRVFPITIDPTYASMNVITNLDTEVSKANPSTKFHSSTELRVGTYNGGSDILRTFLNFPTSSFKNKDIRSASLSVYEFHSWSCTPKPLRVHRADPASSSTTWNAQPTLGALLKTIDVAKGIRRHAKPGESMSM